RRLDVAADPDAGFVSESLAGMLPSVRRARARDRRFAGRIWRDVRALTGQPVAIPRALGFVVAVLVIALVAGLVIVYVGSQRRLPPPFGLARNGAIAYIADDHVVVADADGSNARKLTTGEAREADPTFSRDGTRLAWRAFQPASTNGTGDV